MKLEEIRQLIDEATPGPWSAVGRTIYDEEGIEVFTVEADNNTLDDTDARFIAASRMLLPVLLEVVALAKECGNATSHEVFPPLSSRLRQALAALEALKLP